MDYLSQSCSQNKKYLTSRHGLKLKDSFEEILEFTADRIGYLYCCYYSEDESADNSARFSLNKLAPLKIMETPNGKGKHTIPFQQTKINKPLATNLMCVCS